VPPRAKNRSLGFSPGKLRSHLFNNGVFNRKPSLTTEHTEKESCVCRFFGRGKTRNDVTSDCARIRGTPGQQP